MLRWQRTGVPKGRDVAGLAKLGKRAELNTRLQKLLGVATKRGIVKKTKTTTVKHRTGIRTGGYEATFAIDDFLNDAAIDEAERALERFRPPKTWANWLVAAKLFQLGHLNPAGYKTVQVLSSDKGSAENSVDEDVLTSGKRKRRSDAVRSVVSELRDTVGDGRWFASIYITTYYPLTDEQRRQRATMRRRKWKP